MKELTLTAANMGPNTTEADFDAWRNFVAEHVDAAMGFEVQAVEQFAFTSGEPQDVVDGATEEQREAILGWLAHEGWDEFCANGGPGE
jgi:hypothetical protein